MGVGGQGKVGGALGNPPARFSNSKRDKLARRRSRLGVANESSGLLARLMIQDGDGTHTHTHTHGGMGTDGQGRTPSRPSSPSPRRRRRRHISPSGTLAWEIPRSDGIMGVVENVGINIVIIISIIMAITEHEEHEVCRARGGGTR